MTGFEQFLGNWLGSALPSQGVYLSNRHNELRLHVERRRLEEHAAEHIASRNNECQPNDQWTMSPLSSQLVIVLRHASLVSIAKFISVGFSFCHAGGESRSKMPITIKCRSSAGGPTRLSKPSRLSSDHTGNLDALGPVRPSAMVRSYARSE